MKLKDLRKQHRLIDLFVELAEIPSPSLQEKELSKRILEIFDINNISAKLDSFGNVVAKIPPSVACKDVEPILLSAHMDVVGGSEPVNIDISRDKKYIETDKTRTLGADDKVGVASILDLAIKLNDLNSDIEHGPIEICFTKDEEMGMTGIRNLDTSIFSSKYVVVADADKLGEHDTEGAGFTNVYIKAYKSKGGHSGIDIADESRVNAIKVITELDSKIPQGAYKKDERGVVTSINAGSIIGGAANTAISEMNKKVYKLAKSNNSIPEKYTSNKLLDTICHESAVNIINTQANISYSIRSSNVAFEKELLDLIRKEVKILSEKYKNRIKIELDIQTHLKPFVSSPDSDISKAIIKAGEKNGIKSLPGIFHAGAETHIYANDKLNAHKESFLPVLIGVATLENLHSFDERLDWLSFLEGRKFLEDIVVYFAQINSPNS